MPSTEGGVGSFMLLTPLLFPVIKKLARESFIGHTPLPCGVTYYAYHTIFRACGSPSGCSSDNCKDETVNYFCLTNGICKIGWPVFRFVKRTTVNIFTPIKKHVVVHINEVI